MTVKTPKTARDEPMATLHYSDGEYAVLRPGRFVRCAVSGKPIPLEALRYWSADRQEAYASPAEFMERMGVEA
ncbi:MAG: DUF2093 domain-containing protein [Brevundimonas sp.]